MIRILIVDSDVQQLSVVTDMLHNENHRWELIACESSEKALKLLPLETFEVVLADIRMPGIDGIDFMRHVRRHQPMAIRIMLSRPDEELLAMRAVNIAHQFLTKPFSSIDLVSTLERALSLQEVLTGRELRQKIAQMGTLPSMPHRFWQLQQMLVDPNASIRDAATVIEGDIGMTSKILQLVNSAFFGRPRRVTKLTHAVGLLGLRLLRDLALATEAFSLYSGKDPPDFFPEMLQNHNLLVAAVAKDLVGNHPLSDDVYIAGLLHDMGRLAIAARLPEAWLKICAEQRVSDEPVEVLEKRVIGMTHSEIGAYLLGLWRLPLSVVEAVRFHHRPSESDREGFGPMDAIHIADVVADELLEHGISTTGGSKFDMERLEALGIDGHVDTWRATAARIARGLDLEV